ncbi:hypothetical protein DVH24_033480 [Malus domestica]|uniref:Replication protein A OB domain-containing protein n=1 Tax=Malus domestica TaxID=3750 RepID=A0A498JEX0_MALDO|nr:hypothetical protein DVH24_033480 [Malus domestica]
MGETVRITLWGKIAMTFEDIGMQSRLETLLLKALDQLFVFSIQRFHSSPNTNKNRAISPNFESKTIDELLILDHALHKNASFACKATIVGFDLTRGWWYKSCPSYHKALPLSLSAVDHDARVSMIVERQGAIVTLAFSSSLPFSLPQILFLDLK